MSITAHAASTETKAGWQAELNLEFTKRDNKTVLSKRRQRGPLAIQRPFYPEGSVCHAYVLHPPGGVVGGDQLGINLTVDSSSDTLLTTPGATKFYRSGGRHAQQTQQFDVHGSLEWLPQENIFFPGADCALNTRINLNKDARYIGWDIQCLGRPAISETFDQGALHITTHLHRDNTPLFIDRLTIDANNLQHAEHDLHGIAGLRGHPVVATLIATPANQTTLETARACCTPPLQQGIASTTLMNDTLIGRYLGNSTAEAHRVFRAIWHAIRPDVMHRAAITPRIWNT